jgi:BRCA1-associated protein
LDTEHLYALELNTQRVWDYCGDRYVHRLIQNQQDGKLVELSPWAYGNGSSSKDKKGEMESVEDLTLLTTMMDSQKMYYEAELELLNRKISQLNQKMAKLSTSTGTPTTSKKPDKNQTNYQKVLKELDEERQMSGQILQKQQVLEKKVHDLEKENEDLQDQVKDLMFFMDARDKVESNPSLKDADIVIKPSRK